MEVPNDRIEFEPRLRGERGRVSMSNDTIELRDAIAREREAERLLGSDLVRLAREGFPGKSLYEYVVDAYGGLEELREQRRSESVRLSRDRTGAADRRRIALELGDFLGVDRRVVEAELKREGEEGSETW